MTAYDRDATSTVDDDGAETNPFSQAHFDQLREQGLWPDSQNETCPISQARLNVREQGLWNPQQLELERAPQLRLLFQQPEGVSQITLTAEQREQVRLKVPGESSAFRALHSRAQLKWSCHTGRIRATMFLIPWKEDILIKNEGNESFSLGYGPDGLDVFEITPRQYALIYPGHWRIFNSESTLECLVYPHGYRILLKDEAIKRPAEHPIPSSKRPKTLSGIAGRDDVQRTLPQDRKIVIRPTIVDVDMLISTGLAENQTLNMVDAITGQFEYSIRRIGPYLKRTESTDVFKASWKEGSSEPAVVAVKLYKIVSTQPREIAIVMDRWKREFQAHRNLAHPCIANLLDFDFRLLALIIEHRHAHDLSTPYWCPRSGPVAQRCRFKGSTEDACRILADVSSALAYLSGQGLVHNDIKAGNILYHKSDPAGGLEARAILIDFGLSRILDSEPCDGGGGSPWYVAPEWLLHGRRDPPADVFSLGVVMLYLLRLIRLPEKEHPGWIVNAVRQDANNATISMRRWLTYVGSFRNNLCDTRASSKETKLRSLVRRMLSNEKIRISACELAKETADWAGGLPR